MRWIGGGWNNQGQIGGLIWRMLEKILAAHQQEAERAFQLIAAANIFPTIRVQGIEHAFVSIGGQIDNGMFFNGLGHVLSLRRDCPLSGGSSVSRNNPESIQNFLCQLGRAICSLSAPSRLCHLTEALVVRQQVREDGPNLNQIGLGINVVGGNDCGIGSGGRLGVEPLVLVLVPGVGQVQGWESGGFNFGHTVGTGPRNHQIGGAKGV